MGTAQELLNQRIETLQRLMECNLRQIKNHEYEMENFKSFNTENQNEIDALKKAIKVLDSNKTTRSKK
jgi:hypothetical protein